MTKNKKHRPHILHDPSLKETRNIEPIRANANIVEPVSDVKASRKHLHKKLEPRTHEYEYSPNIEKNKGVGATLQRVLKNKISRQQKREH